MWSVFNRVVAIPTVHAQVARVELVTERDRLIRLVADIRELWREPVGDREGRNDDSRGNTEDHEHRDLIDPTGKDVCQVRTPDCWCAPRAVLAE